MMPTRRIARYGWRRPHLHVARARFAAHRPVLSASLPISVDWSPNFPPCYDQGQLGSCTANALAGAVQWVGHADGDANSPIPSRLFIYYNERAIEGTIPYDAGASLSDGIACLKQQGACPEADWPYVEGQFAARPPAQAYADGLDRLITSALSIDNTQLNQIKTAIYQGRPPVIGFTVYESFEGQQVAQTGIVAMPGRGEAIVGGHAVLIVGFDDRTGLFKVRNSWGTDWGQKGYFVIPYAYLTNPDLADDCWSVESVTSPVPPTPPTPAPTPTPPTPDPDWSNWQLVIRDRRRGLSDIPMSVFA